MGVEDVFFFLVRFGLGLDEGVRLIENIRDFKIRVRRIIGFSEYLVSGVDVFVYLYTWKRVFLLF